MAASERPVIQTVMDLNIDDERIGTRYSFDSKERWFIQH